MSLITRCPACGTMFKVVTDQLKVSQGWVRCGQCSDVFDASLHLLPGEPAPPVAEISADAAVTSALEDTEPTPLAPAKGLSAENSIESNQEPQPVPQSQSANAPDAEPLTEAEWSFQRWVAGKLTPATAPALQFDEAHDSAADFDPAGWKDALRKRQQRDDGAASAFASMNYGGAGINPDSDFAGVAEEPPRRPDLVRKVTIADAEFEEEFDNLLQAQPVEQKQVSFVRDAERKALWTRPVVRAALLAAALLLTLVLAGQIAVQQKDSLAAWDPRWAAVLEKLCDGVGCKIQSPRHVEFLVIDSSTFSKLEADAYRLNFVLKNTSNLPVEMPAIEVTLTDLQDQPVVRRIVLPAQFGAPSLVLGARSEMAGAISMKIAVEAGRNASSSSAVSAAPPLRVAGYRVLAFYP